MSKSNIINISIYNKTSYDLTYSDDYFAHGGLGDGYSWPSTIPAGSQPNFIQCYEADFSPFGCSGWVKYIMAGQEVFFFFSNPAAGQNGIALGNKTDGWDYMTGEYNNGITVPLQLDGNLWLVGHISSTPGNKNHAVYQLKCVDVSLVTPANIEMNNVPAVFNNISPFGTRQYYTCEETPTNLAGLAQSHFKGISVFNDKFIFSHTNLTFPPAYTGRYIIADQITGIEQQPLLINQGTTELTSDTAHDGWVHPCSSQACGSFMALGIQENVKNPNNTSEIQIYDLRPTQINQPAVYLNKNSIWRTEIGVNGVGMTKESGSNGNYVVATINGNHLIVYRSSTPNLLTDIIDWSAVIDEPNFPESGAGLALITETSGDIYLLTMNAEDDGSDPRIGLFKLDLNNNTYTTVVAKYTMPIPGVSQSIKDLEVNIATILLVPGYAAYGLALEALLLTLGEKYLNSSFRYGKGLKIIDSDTLEIYATDRNVLPLSHIPITGSLYSNKDFSMVTWTTENGPPDGMQLSIQTINNNLLLIVNDGGMPGTNVAIETSQTTLGNFETFTFEMQDRINGVFALKTYNGNYLTAVNGGGMGTIGDNNPVHTNGNSGAQDEVLIMQKLDHGKYALKTPSGYYLTAVNGGGVGDDSQPLMTTATTIGQNELFSFLGVGADKK